MAKNIEERAVNDLFTCNIGGASILVVQQGEVVYKAHCGSLVSDNTIFRLASMTKPITAVATMILVDRGLLSLEGSQV